MSSVPYTFANSVGNIPLNYLDANFSNVKAYANTAGTVTTASQPNITNVGTLSSLTVSGNVTASNFIGNIAGNISNAVYAESAGTVTTAAQPNITSIGTLTVLTASGNIRTTGGSFVGSAAGLTNMPGANVTGTVANATYATSAGTATTATSATTAGTVTTAAQPNITSVGTLSSLTVTGNITSSTGVIFGNAGGLTNLIGANVTGTVANATYADSSNSSATAGTVTTAAQPNITSVGTLTSLTVTGNITGNIANAVYAESAGTVTTAAQPNITSVGTLGNLSVDGNISFGSTGNGLLYNDLDGFSVISSSNNSAGTYMIANSSVLVGSDPTLGVLLITVEGATERRVSWNYGSLNLNSSNSIPGNIINAGNITASGTITIPSVITNTITSDDSSYVTIEDGLNVVGDVDAINITVTTVKTLPVTANLLPSASAAGAGTRAFVTDADSVTFGNLVVGGAGNNMPVFSNGTNWYIG